MKFESLIVAVNMYPLSLFVLDEFLSLIETYN